MASGLLLDTHILLRWMSAGTPLHPATKSLIDSHHAQGATLWVSAVSAWEIGALAGKGRISLDRPLGDWLGAVLQQPGFAFAPVTLGIAVRSYSLPGLEHGDPADRLLIAAAIDLRVPLVTYDRRITAYADEFGDGVDFRVLS